MPGKAPSRCGLCWIETSVSTESVLLPACHAVFQMHAKGMSQITQAADETSVAPKAAAYYHDSLQRSHKRTTDSQGHGMVQRAAVALWTPEVAAALCERKSMLPPSGVNLGLRALFSDGVKHTDCCSCA